jgi:hypothetical protein
LGISNHFAGSEISKYPEKFGYTITDIQKGQWKNKYWDSILAKEYTDSIMQQAWNSGRQKIAGWVLIGMQNNPTLYERFKNYTINNLDFELLDHSKKIQWETYRDSVFNYEESV